MHRYPAPSQELAGSLYALMSILASAEIRRETSGAKKIQAVEHYVY